MPIGKTEARYRTESFCSNFLDSSGVKTSFALPGASVPQPPAKAPRAEKVSLELQSQGKLAKPPLIMVAAGS
jgi:hypothetical protein